jgi:hypothetical protein
MQAYETSDEFPPGDILANVADLQERPFFETSCSVGRHLSERTQIRQAREYCRVQNSS